MQLIDQLIGQTSQIAYFSGASNYTWLQLRNGDRQLLAKPLTYFEQRLPGFVRIHKTALINPMYVSQVFPPLRAKMAGAVLMEDGIKLPVSRRRWEQVLLELHPIRSSTAAADETKGQIETNATTPAVSAACMVLAITSADGLSVIRQCMDGLGLTCALHHLERGAELASALQLAPPDEQPTLIILDARANKADRVLTLSGLKRHKRLRAIPVIWLAARDADTTQAYELDANSVIVVSDDDASFTRAIEQVCQYWLMIVQLPPSVAVLSQ
ncbi:MULTISPECIES: response regulator transcription factor [Spirosoma]|uniref:LytTR family transcriptional regulator n=1 Tax=Spirosoma sordidisoli TaxID=2502893 RepID=A0A4Q2ULD1_9BACT|nr:MULTISPECIES: LytTR family transcriptional regulator DNA-binding domain-containing protein [Spirosoma]RYC70343.1 LytTR family transcriptional regulator [Spirosoma sordidisoli]